MFSWSCYLIFYNRFYSETQSFLFHINGIYIKSFSQRKLYFKNLRHRRGKKIYQHRGQWELQGQNFSLWPIALLTPPHHLLKLIIANTMDLLTNSHRHFDKISRYQPHFTEKKTQSNKLFSSVYTSHYPTVLIPNKFR